MKYAMRIIIHCFIYTSASGFGNSDNSTSNDNEHNNDIVPVNDYDSNNE